MTVLLLIFILGDTGRWEFSNLERISAPFDVHEYCERLAEGARDAHTRAVCVEDEGVEI